MVENPAVEEYLVVSSLIHTIIICCLTWYCIHQYLLKYIHITMCCDGAGRPSAGGRIAVMFPPKITGGSSASSTLNPYTLFFHNTQTANDVIRTRAVFRFDDPSTLKALQNCKNVDLRIE